MYYIAGFIILIAIVIDCITRTKAANQKMSTDNEEVEKEDAVYLKRRIRPAMEYLIGQENIDGMKKLADRGWFGEQELNGFLTKAGELEKWDAFRVLLAWKNHISVKEKSTATETKQELIAGLMKHCKNELCWR